MVEKIKEIRQKIDINIKMAAAGTLHNNQSDSSDDDDPEFKLWLDEHLK